MDLSGFLLRNARRGAALNRVGPVAIPTEILLWCFEESSRVGVLMGRRGALSTKKGWGKEAMLTCNAPVRGFSGSFVS